MIYTNLIACVLHRTCMPRSKASQPIYRPKMTKQMNEHFLHFDYVQTLQQQLQALKQEGKFIDDYTEILSIRGKECPGRNTKVASGKVFKWFMVVYPGCVLAIPMKNFRAILEGFDDRETTRCQGSQQKFLDIIITNKAATTIIRCHLPHK